MNNNEIVDTTGAKKLRFGFPKKNANQGVECFKPLFDLGGNRSLGVSTIGELVNAVTSGSLTGFTENRGGGKNRLSISRCKKMAKKFKPNEIHQLTLADFGNNNYVISVGHHRIGAMLEVQDMNQLYGIADLPVSVAVVPSNELVSSYAVEGSAKGHTLKVKLMNKMMGFGKKIKNFLMAIDLSPVGGLSLLPNEPYVLIAKLLYAASTIVDPSEVPFEKLMTEIKGNAITDLADMTVAEFNQAWKPNKRAEDRLAKSIGFAAEVMKEVILKGDINKGRESTAQLSTVASTIKQNSTLFLFLVWDHFAGHNIITEIHPKTIAEKLINKYSLTDDALSNLSTKRYGVAINRLWKIVRTKTKTIEIT